MLLEHLAMGIYVEIPIHASMDELWEKTQNPQLHQRWDLRFTQIEYLPREDEEPQRFLYRTRIGFGLKIDGQGESIGERDGDDGARTSSLKFWSEDPKPLYQDRIELDLLSRITPPDFLRTAATFAGVLEVCFAFLLILLWRQTWPLWVTIVLMLAGIPIVALTAPEYLHAAFNPVTLNISLAVFAGIALVVSRDLATAASCLRKPKENS